MLTNQKDSLKRILQESFIDTKIRKMLHSAILRVKPDILEAFLQYAVPLGFDVNMEPDLGLAPPLEAAFQQDNTAAIDVLTRMRLEIKLDLKHRFKPDNRTFLHRLLAIRNCKAMDSNETTPFFNPQTLKKFLETIEAHELDINATNHYGCSVLSLQDNGEFLQILLPLGHKFGLNINSAKERPSHFEEWLELPAAIDIFKLLFLHGQQLGLNVNAVDSEGKTLLHCIAGSKNSELLRLALSYAKTYPFDLKAKDKEGMTPLMIAAAVDYQSFMLLLNADPDIELHDCSKDGIDLVMLAVFSDKLETLTYLLSHGDWNFNRQIQIREDSEFPEKYQGATALITAIEGEEPDYALACVAALLKYRDKLQDKSSFDLSIKNRAGHDALKVSLLRGYKLIFQLLFHSIPPDLQQKDQNGFTIFLLAVAMGQYDIIQFLLSADADIKAVDHKNRNALHWASKIGHPQLINYFIAQGLSLDAKDQWGNTPLLIAVREGLLATSERLISQGAQVNAYNTQGYTALHLAILADDLAMIRLLLKFGADPQFSNPLMQESPQALATRLEFSNIRDALNAQAENKAAARLEQVLVQLAPRPQQTTHQAVTFLRLFPLSKRAQLSPFNTLNLLTQTQTALSIQGKTSEEMLQSVPQARAYLPLEDLEKRELLAQSVGDIRDLRLTLYTGCSYSILFFRLILRELASLIGKDPSLNPYFQAFFKYRFIPTRAPDLARFQHSQIDKSSVMKEGDWCNASLFGNGARKGACSLYYYLESHNNENKSFKELISQLFSCMKWDVQGELASEFLRKIDYFYQRLYSPLGGFQTIEIPYALVDAVCHPLHFKGFTNKDKFSEYVLKARAKPALHQQFSNLEIIVLPDSIFNPDNGISSRIYHTLDRLHPDAFQEFKLHIKSSLWALLKQYPLIAALDPKVSKYHKS